MHRTPLRIGVFVLAVLVTAGLGFRAYEDEHQLSAARAEAARISGVAAQAFEKLADLRASLHAYVAPGQDIAFWTKRAQATVDALRQDMSKLLTACFDAGDGKRVGSFEPDGGGAIFFRAEWPVTPPAC